MRIFVALAACFALAACSGEKAPQSSTDNVSNGDTEVVAVDGGNEPLDHDDDQAAADDLDAIAEDFVKLALAAGCI